MLAIAYGKPDFDFLSAFFQSPRCRLQRVRNKRRYQ
jgi:hypothetical protein